MYGVIVGEITTYCVLFCKYICTLAFFLVPLHRGKNGLT